MIPHGENELLPNVYGFLQDLGNVELPANAERYRLSLLEKLSNSQTQCSVVGSQMQPRSKTDVGDRPPLPPRPPSHATDPVWLACRQEQDANLISQISPASVSKATDACGIGSVSSIDDDETLDYERNLRQPLFDFIQTRKSRIVQPFKYIRDMVSSLGNRDFPCRSKINSSRAVLASEPHFHKSGSKWRSESYLLSAEHEECGLVHETSAYTFMAQSQEQPNAASKQLEKRKFLLPKSAKQVCGKGQCKLVQGICRKHSNELHNLHSVSLDSQPAYKCVSYGRCIWDASTSMEPIFETTAHWCKALATRSRKAVWAKRLLRVVLLANNSLSTSMVLVITKRRARNFINHSLFYFRSRPHSRLSVSALPAERSESYQESDSEYTSSQCSFANTGATTSANDMQDAVIIPISNCTFTYEDCAFGRSFVLRIDMRDSLESNECLHMNMFLLSFSSSSDCASLLASVSPIERQTVVAQLEQPSVPESLQPIPVDSPVTTVYAERQSATFELRDSYSPSPSPPPLPLVTTVSKTGRHRRTKVHAHRTKDLSGPLLVIAAGHERMMQCTIRHARFEMTPLNTNVESLEPLRHAAVTKLEDLGIKKGSSEPDSEACSSNFALFNCKVELDIGGAYRFRIMQGAQLRAVLQAANEAEWSTWFLALDRLTRSFDRDQSVDSVRHVHQRFSANESDCESIYDEPVFDDRKVCNIRRSNAVCDWRMRQRFRNANVMHRRAMSVTAHSLSHSPDTSDLGSVNEFRHRRSTSAHELPSSISPTSVLQDCFTQTIAVAHSHSNTSINYSVTSSSFRTSITSDCSDNASDYLVPIRVENYSSSVNSADKVHLSATSAMTDAAYEYGESGSSVDIWAGKLARNSLGLLDLQSNVANALDVSLIPENQKSASLYNCTDSRLYSVSTQVSNDTLAKQLQNLFA